MLTRARILTAVGGVTVVFFGLLTGVGCGFRRGEPLGLPVDDAAFSLDLGEHESGGESPDVVGSVVDGALLDGKAVEIVVDYPHEGSVFPPEIVAPTFRFRDPDAENTRWLIHVDFNQGERHHYVLSDADAGRIPMVIDQRCVTNSNTWKPTPEQASARAWTPDSDLWQLMKEQSVSSPLKISFYGTDKRGRSMTSFGEVTLGTSADPAGAPVFYRDVPLMPSENLDGVVKPLDQGALPLIACSQNMIDDAYLYMGLDTTPEKKTIALVPDGVDDLALWGRETNLEEFQKDRFGVFISHFPFGLSLEPIQA
jgi:hypothetical protein